MWVCAVWVGAAGLRLGLILRWRLEASFRAFQPNTSFDIRASRLCRSFLSPQNLQRNVKGARSAVWHVTNIAIEHDSGAVPGRRRRYPSAAFTLALAIRLWRLSLRVWPLKLPGT